MVISMTVSLCEKASARSIDRGRDGSNSAGGFFLNAATYSALTKINGISRISLRCDHSSSEKLPCRLHQRVLSRLNSANPSLRPDLSCPLLLQDFTMPRSRPGVADALTALTEAAGVAGAALIVFKISTGKVDEAHFCGLSAGFK